MSRIVQRFPSALVLAILTFLAYTPNAFAVVKLPNLFGDGMVLQRDAKIPIWGSADPGEIIVVEFNESQETTEANSEGKWRVDLPPQKEGRSLELVVSASNKIVVKDVCVGEVWICAGQSNMSFPLKRALNAEKEIASANYPSIRFLTVPAQASETPMDDFDAHWRACSPQTARELSAVAYYFGRDIGETLNCPVGLIVLAWGGSTAEAWTDQNKIAQYSDLATLLEPKRLEKTAEHQKAGRLFNGMVFPVCPFAIRGVVWYQGESNANRAWQYRALFPLTIANWRESWGQGDFPFYYVQLPNYMKAREKPSQSAWAELREAQHKTLAIRNVGEVVTVDAGDSNDLHPKNKEIVGTRLARLALGKTYMRDVSYAGPEFRSMKIVDNKAILTFSNTGKGLKILPNSQCDDTELRGFAIAGKDKKFYWANAQILGDEVVVSAPEAPNPIAVRYAWADNPICNLGNDADLPASPFRTDDWVGVTVDSY